MEILDKVYATFKDLDKNYARSKKTREEFIIDKFGGDIDIGSLIILDTISSQMGDATPEDIQKFTFIKEIFEKIKESREDLNSLCDFTFTNGSLFQNFLNVLEQSYTNGTHITLVTQKSLRKRDKSAVHFVAGGGGLLESPFAKCKVLHTFNENMLGLIGATSKGPDFEMFKYYEKKNAVLAVELLESRIDKTLK